MCVCVIGEKYVIVHTVIYTLWCCTIVYPERIGVRIAVSADEGELIRAVVPLKVQGYLEIYIQCEEWPTGIHVLVGFGWKQM